MLRLDIVRRTSPLPAIVLALAGCASETTPTSPAAPPPDPPPDPAPVQRARIWLYSAPAYAAGYVEGETIRLVTEFEETVSVVGSPRMALEVGDGIRFAQFSPWVEDDWPPERPSFRQRFEYVVRAEDHDEDGIRIGADPFDFSEGAFVNVAGTEVDVEIYSVTPTRTDEVADPGEPLGSHRVAGTLIRANEPRECTDERDRALAYHDAILPAEWDGTAILVRFLDPEGEEQREDLAREIENVIELAAQIEQQIGYRILDVSRDLIPRAEADPAMLEVTQAHEAWRSCNEWRTPGHAYGFVVDYSHSVYEWSDAAAVPRCAGFMYYGGEVAPAFESTTPHELFHLFGFKHHPNHGPETDPEDVGIYMSWPLSAGGSEATPLGPRLGATFDDIDALRCVFPP